MGTSTTAARRHEHATRPDRRRVLVVALATLAFTAVALAEVPPTDAPTELWPTVAAAFIWTTLVWDGRSHLDRNLPAHLLAQLVIFVGCAAVFGWPVGQALWLSVVNVGGGVLMALVYARFGPGPDWAPRTATAHVGLLVSGASAGAVVGLLGGFPHVGFGDLDLLLGWWVIRSTVYAYVGGVTFLFLFAPHRPRPRPAPRWAVALLVPLGTAALWATYLDPELPLTWSMLLPAVLAGTILTPRGAATYALSVAVGAALATLHPINQFDYEGILPGSLIIDLLITASTFITLQLAILREQQAVASEELDLQTRAARVQAGLLARVFDTVSDGLVVVDDQTRVVLHNTAARQLLGRRIPIGQELVWTTDLGVIEAGGPPTDRPEGHRPQIVVEREDGQRVLDVGTWPLPGPDQRTLVLFSDVTAQRERLGELTRFAGVVAHDLRSPLSSLAGWLEMAGDALTDSHDPSAAAASAFVGRARVSGDRMQQVIEDWLTYTVQRDGLLAPTELPLRPLVSAVVAPYSSGAAVSSDGLAPVFDVEVDDTVQADPALTRQLFANLVSNAVKYTPPGERPKVRISSTPDSEPGFVKVTVADHGIGLPAGEEELVFEEFHRAPGHAEDYSGTGLGLSLCRKIVVRHGGTIRARNDDHDGGAVFTFTLPAA